MSLQTIGTLKQGLAQTELSQFKYQVVHPSDTKDLSKVWQLVAGNMAHMGDVHPVDAMDAAKDTIFDHHKNTRVITIKDGVGRLVGTFSMTVDSDNGMPVLHHFNEELVFLRKKYRLVNGWRFSMHPLYQNANLRLSSFALFKQLIVLSGADAFVLYFNERLARYYSRYFNGRIVASKVISFDGINKLPVSLMVCESINNFPDREYIQDGGKYADSMVF